MSAVVEQIRYTPDDLLRMPDGERLELVDGGLPGFHCSVCELFPWLQGSSG